MLFDLNSSKQGFIYARTADSPQHLQNLATCWLYWTATLCAADLLELPVLISGNIWRNINMGWEYRVFMPAPCSVTLPGVRGARETREDTYIPVSPGWAQIKIDVMKTLTKVSVRTQNFLVVLVPPCNPREIGKWTMNRVDYFRSKVFCNHVMMIQRIRNGTWERLHKSHSIGWDKLVQILPPL